MELKMGVRSCRSCGVQKSWGLFSADWLRNESSTKSDRQKHRKSSENCEIKPTNIYKGDEEKDWTSQVCLTVQRHISVSGLGSHLEKLWCSAAAIWSFVLSLTGDGDTLTLRITSLRLLWWAGFSLTTADLLHGENNVRLLHSTAAEEEDDEYDDVVCSPFYFFFLTTSSRVMWFDPAAFKVPEYEVEADDGLGLRRLAAVEDGRLRLGPDEAAAVRQEAVVSGVHLTFGQHYRETGQKTIWFVYRLMQHQNPDVQLLIKILSTTVGLKHLQTNRQKTLNTLFPSLTFCRHNSETQWLKSSSTCFYKYFYVVFLPTGRFRFRLEKYRIVRETKNRFFFFLVTKHTWTLTCVQALVDVIRVERVMKLIGWAANQIFRFVSNQLCHPGNRWKKNRSIIISNRHLHLSPVSSWFQSTERSKVSVSDSPAAGDESSHLPLQCVKRRSMLWRVRKVKLSRGNSTLDGWGMGSHSRVVTLAAGGDKEPPPNGRMWPVQWRTWRNRGGSLKTERFSFLAKCTQQKSDLRLHSPKFQVSVCVKFGSDAK